MSYRLTVSPLCSQTHYIRYTRGKAPAALYLQYKRIINLDSAGVKKERKELRRKEEDRYKKEREKERKEGRKRAEGVKRKKKMRSYSKSRMWSRLSRLQEPQERRFFHEESVSRETERIDDRRFFFPFILFTTTSRRGRDL